MARIVLGMGTSHSPLLTLPAAEWTHRAEADLRNPQLNLSDGRVVTYEQLRMEVGDIYKEDVALLELERKAHLCQMALDKLADTLEEVDPDVVVIVGDDQRELFGPSNQPAFSVFFGDSVVMSSKLGEEDVPAWLKTVGKGYMMDAAHILPGSSALALDVIQGLLDRSVDVATAACVEQEGSTGFGHAFGFIVQRLFKGRKYPVIPILLNTYYPPNVPTAARCYDIGQALRDAITASPKDLKVAIIASGGLSHFVVDEKLDRTVIDGLDKGKSYLLKEIPRAALNSGSSEILNWVLVAGSVCGTPLGWSEYIPLYRTPAGTGVGVAFAIWGSTSE